MRTPLSCIQSCVAKLLELDLDSAAQLSDLKRSIKLLYFQSNLLECFVNDLLDTKMIQNGHFSQNSQAFDPKKVFKLVMEIFKDQACAQKTELRLLIESSNPDHGEDYEHQSQREGNDHTDQSLPILVGDKRRLLQVLINLIKNSLKFTYDGEIVICVAYSHLNHKLRVRICDTGTGIALADQSKLFKSFGKLVNSTSYRLNQDGVGLGLAICHALVTQNGGEISVFSEGHSKGTTFSFDFVLYPYQPPIPTEEDYNQSLDYERHSVMLADQRLEDALLNLSKIEVREPGDVEDGFATECEAVAD